MQPYSHVFLNFIRNQLQISAEVRGLLQLVFILETANFVPAEARDDPPEIVHLKDVDIFVEHPLAIEVLF